MRVATLATALLAALTALAVAAPVHRRYRHDWAGDVTTVAVDWRTTDAGEQFHTVVRRVQDVSGGHVQQDVTIPVYVVLKNDGTVVLNGAAVPLDESHLVGVEIASIPGVPPTPTVATVALRFEKLQAALNGGSNRALYNLFQTITETAGAEVHTTTVTYVLGYRTEDGKLEKKGFFGVEANGEGTTLQPLTAEPAVWTSARHVHGGKNRPGHHYGGGMGGHHGGGKGSFHHRPQHPAQTAPTDGAAPPEDIQAPPAPADAAMNPGGCGVGQAVHQACANVRAALGRAYAWLNGLPLALRALISFTVGAMTAYILLSLLTCSFGGRCCKSCKKAAPSTYDTNLQVYALQYTALPADEKDALKKEQKEGSVEVTV